MGGILKDFANETTLHGLPKVITSSNVFKRLAWFVLFLCALGTMTWQTSKLFEQFLSFRKTVSLDVDRAVMQFPSVTLCSESGVSVAVKEDIAEHIRGYDIQDAFNFSYNIFANLSVIDHHHQNGNCSGHVCSVSREYLQWFSNVIKTALTFVFENYKLDGYLLAANLGLNLSTHAGVHLQDNLYSCHFDGHPCSVKNFTVYRDPRYLLCYTFGTEALAKVGRERGLKLVLKYTPLSDKILRLNSLPGLSSPDMSPGFRISVHSPNSAPSLNEDGIVLYPGLKASLGFSTTVYKRIGKPYGNCTDRATLTDTNIPYTYVGCSNEYKQELIRSICNCTDIALPFHEHELEQYPYCRKLSLPLECNSNASFWQNVNMMKPETLTLIPEACKGPTSKLYQRLDCIASADFTAYMRMTEIDQSLRCFPPCSQRKFEVRDVRSDWPTTEDFILNLGQLVTQDIERYQEMLDYSMRWTYREAGTQNPLDDFRKKFLQVNVFLRDNDVTTIREQALYEWYQLLSEFGGIVGLYLGMSVMTLCELLELVFQNIFNISFGKKTSSSRIHSLKM